MRVTQNVAMLEITGGNSTVYPALLWDDKELILVDACFPGQFGALKKAVADEGFEVEQITRIMLTHQDMDHIGCVRDILSANPGVVTIAHEAEIPYIDGTTMPIKMAVRDASYDALSDAMKASHDAAKASLSSRVFPVNQAVTADERLPFCGGIRVIHTPGHTPGHVCLFIEAGGILIAGDGLNLLEGELMGPNPIHTYDMHMAIRSLEPLTKYDVMKVIAYHGGLFSGDFQAGIQVITDQ